MLRYDPYDSQARLIQATAPGAAADQQLQALRLAIRNTCVNPNFAQGFTQFSQDPTARPLMGRWMADADAALRLPEPARWSDPLALETLRIAVVVAGQQGRFAEAKERATQAATLLKHLAADPWRNRPEAVEIEVYLDQAWFVWLSQPEAMRDLADALERYLRDQPEQSVGTYSRRMAGHFLAMLRLAQGQLDDANRALYLADPMIRPEAMQRLKGLGYARLVTLRSARVPPREAQTWASLGTALLGEAAWKQAVEAAASRGAAPWWLGVMAAE
jgi:hypothetical protein